MKIFQTQLCDGHAMAPARKKSRKLPPGESNLDLARDVDATAQSGDANPESRAVVVCWDRLPDETWLKG